MKPFRLLQQICQFLQSNLIVLIAFANIVNTNCYPLTQDEISNKVLLEEEKQNISTNFVINSITDSIIQKNDGNYGSKQDKKTYFLKVIYPTKYKNKTINHNPYVSDKSYKRIEQILSENHLVTSNDSNYVAREPSLEHKFMKENQTIDIASNQILEEAASSVLDLPTCILGSSHVYLSWWVNENGSLRHKLADNNACASITV
jgi:hypothetical protein